MKLFLVLVAVLVSQHSFGCQQAAPGTWRRLSDRMMYVGVSDPKAVEVCESMHAAFAKENCKETVKQKLYSDAALSYCAALDSDKTKQECLDQYAGTYVAADALNLCLEMKSAFEQARCLTEIRDRVFEAKDIAHCQSQSEHRRRTCLDEKAICILDKTTSS